MDFPAEIRLFSNWIPIVSQELLARFMISYCIYKPLLYEELLARILLLKKKELLAGVLSFKRKELLANPSFTNECLLESFVKGNT